MRQFPLLLASALVLFPTTMTAAADDFVKAAYSCKPPERIRFARGATRARFEGSIDRFQDACFLFSAKSGQLLKIELADLQSSANIVVYKPGYRIDYGNYTEQGRYIVWGDQRIPDNIYIGQTLTPSSEDREEALQKFIGTVPQSGDYLVVVDLSGAGAATFNGVISIR